jgi:hypothetical protein
MRGFWRRSIEPVSSNYWCRLGHRKLRGLQIVFSVGNGDILWRGYVRGRFDRRLYYRRLHRLAHTHAQTKSLVTESERLDGVVGGRIYS